MLLCDGFSDSRLLMFLNILINVSACVADIIRIAHMSGQDESNPALRLPTSAGKMERSGLPAVSRKKNYHESHIINLLLTKLVRSRWLEIGLVLFLRVYHKQSSGRLLRLGP